MKSRISTEIGVRHISPLGGSADEFQGTAAASEVVRIPTRAIGRRLLPLLAAGWLAASLSFAMAADQVKFNDLPSAVQKTINAQAGASGIASIQKLTRNGIPIYEVRLSQASNNKPFYVSETGSLINLDNVIAARPAANGSRKGTFRELPPAVQNAVRGQAGSARVEDIDIVTRQGQTNYDVAFKREGKTVELWLDPSGNILNPEAQNSVAASQTRVPLSAASKVQFRDLPEAVRQTLQNYSQGAQIEDVDKGTLQGRTVYEAAFKHNGQNVELRVADDGTVIRDNVNDRYLASIGRAPGGTLTTASTPGTNTPSWASVPARTPLRGTHKVNFRDVPSSVRDTIRTYSNNAQIEDVDKGKLGDQTVYQAAFKHNGQNVELRVAEDGSLVRDDVNQQFLTQFGRPATTGVGRPPSWQILTGGTAGNAQLSNARRVSWEQLPAAVQNTLREQAGPAAIENLSQGTFNGKTVYQGAFTKNGAVDVVRVAPDGSLVR